MAGSGRARVRYSNRLKCLCCYLICFLLPLGWQAAGLLVVYPYRLAGTAPSLAATLSAAVPALAAQLAPYAREAELARADTPDALRLALAARDLQWRAALGVWFALAWLMTLAIQLLWRATHARPVLAARQTRRAISAYRLSMTVIVAVNALFALMVWLAGAHFIEGRTVWDYLVYFAPYALNALAALCCFRLAAPPVLSGRRAFFKRL